MRCDLLQNRWIDQANHFGHGSFKKTKIRIGQWKNLASVLIYFTVRVPSQLASSGAADFFLTVYCKMVCLPRNLMNDSVYHSFD
jgi:hypothetical protein